MKGLLAFVLPLAVSTMAIGVSEGTEIRGKWGLGVSVGELISSRAETSLLRGVSERTAWLADLSISQSMDDLDRTATYVAGPVDTTIYRSYRFDGFTVSVGPRLRRFTNPTGPLSPYFDLYVHFVDSSNHATETGGSASDTQVGGEAGAGLGVEYFLTRWPVSVAAHSDVVRYRMFRHTRKSNYGSPASSQVIEETGTTGYGSLLLSPALQIRVYF